MKSTYLMGLLMGAAALVSPPAFAKTAARPHMKVSASQAKKTALAQYPGKVVGKIKLENEDGAWEYAVNVRSGSVMHEVMVDANTNTVASEEVTTPAEEAAEAKAAKTPTRKPHVKVSAGKARKAALAKYPGKVVGKVTLENEGGQWQYAVNVRSGDTLREVMVDANTGEIAGAEVTAPGADASGAADKSATQGAQPGEADEGNATPDQGGTGESGETQ
jgi:uncharacterized membrane protein YkoI